MAISKIILNGVTQMDLTSDTVAANNLISPNTAHDAAGLAVVGTASGGSPNLQSKSATPTESTQTVTADSGYDGLSSVEVGAISSTYVGSGITRRSSSDLSASWSAGSYTVNAPAGYYESTASKAVPNGTEGIPIATKGTVSNHSVSVTPSVTNRYGYITGGTTTGTAVTVTASELDSGTKQITQNGQGIDVVGYASVDVSVSAPASNLQSKTATPTESVQTITPDSGYDGLSDVEVGAISSTYVGSGITRRSSSDLTASWSAGTFTINAPAGYYESAASRAVSNGTVTPIATKGTVSNHSVSVTPSVDKIAGYITAGTTSGTAVTVTASELVSGTYTVDSSGTKDVTNYASASVPAGTAGTPSATKGAVSNHQVSVTPSVTNVTGWITGSTKNGTAVTVTASELASGNKAIVDNGTNIDVVGYSTVSVAVPFSAITVSSSNPTGGNNGDIWIKTS